MVDRKPPVYDHVPLKTSAEPGSGRYLRRTLGNVLDGALFLYAAFATVMLAWLLLRQGLQLSVWLIVYFLLMWAITAYLTLPRVHLALTSIYVPHYFIGRSRTGDGLLGDPVNLAVDGDEDQIHTAMRRAGWTMADPINVKSSLRIAWGSVSGQSYKEAPVSSLYLFGRKQDFAYQMEVDGNPAQRHHVRFWRCPDDWLLPGGERVEWLAAGTYDRAVGFSLFTLQITHKIDEDIDIERDFIVDSVLYACPDADLRVLENFSTGYHSRNGGGDLVRTDGNLPVMQLQGVVPDAAVSGVASEVDDIAAVSRRPASVLVGIALSVLLMLWDVVGLVVGGFAAMELDAVAVTEEGAVVIIIFAVLLLVLSAFNMVCAWLTYKGVTWARRWLVIGTALSVFVGLQTMAAELHGASFVPTMIQTALGVFVIYALTGPSARDWGRKRL